MAGLINKLYLYKSMTSIVNMEGYIKNKRTIKLLELVQIVLIILFILNLVWIVITAINYVGF